MTGFARRILGLQEVFPSSSAAVAAPQEVTDVVHLTHRWPSAAASLDRLVNVQLVGAPALSPTITAVTEVQGRWTEVLYGDLSHDSATARFIQAVITIGAQNFFIGRWSSFVTAFQPGIPSAFEPLFSGGVSTSAVDPPVTPASDRVLPPWPIIVPPGGQLRFLGNAAGVAYSISVALLLISHPLAEDGVRT